MQKMVRKIEECVWYLYKHFKLDLDNIELSISSYIADISEYKVDDILPIIKRIIKDKKQLKFLLDSPQVKQRSEEWYSLRRDRLTASDTAQSMNLGKFGTRNELLLKKAFPDNYPNLSMNIPPLRHGIMFEAMTARCYSQSYNDILIHEFGLIPHPTLSCFGASPDGITDLGVMVEYKTPYRRKITETIPEQYELQMQGQLAVTNLSECDYVECEMQEFKDIETYLISISPSSLTQHGIFIEINDNEREYIYSPPYLTPVQVHDWLKKTIENSSSRNYKIIPWKMRRMYVERVYFDKQRWDTILKNKIQVFWDDVLNLRNNPPINNHPKPVQQLKDNQDINKKYQFIDSDDEDAN